MSTVGPASEGETSSSSSTATGQAADDETESMTYQIALRVLGAWLDTQGLVSGIRILETTDGFLVQQASEVDPGTDTARTITFEQIWDLDGDKKLRKRSKERNGGNQSFFEAMGYELDEADAHSLLLEAVNEDYLLSYLYPHYVGGFAVLKRFIVITPDSREEILRAARDRRDPGKLAKGFARLIGDE